MKGRNKNSRLQRDLDKLEVLSIDSMHLILFVQKLIMITQLVLLN